MTHSVGLYVLVDPKTKRVRYVGLGDVHVRGQRHSTTPGKEHLRQIIIAKNNLTFSEASGLEQLLTEFYGAPEVYGGLLLNEKWPLGIDNPNFESFIDAATPLVREAIGIVDEKIKNLK